MEIGRKLRTLLLWLGFNKELFAILAGLARFIYLLAIFLLLITPIAAALIFFKIL